jgi:hypothetical protein
VIRSGFRALSTMEGGYAKGLHLQLPRQDGERAGILRAAAEAANCEEVMLELLGGLERAGAAVGGCGCGRFDSSAAGPVPASRHGRRQHASGRGGLQGVWVCSLVGLGLVLGLFLLARERLARPWRSGEGAV